MAGAIRRLGADIHRHTGHYRSRTQDIKTLDQMIESHMGGLCAEDLFNGQSKDLSL
jgi:hypothetical protein